MSKKFLFLILISPFSLKKMNYLHRAVCLFLLTVFSFPHALFSHEENVFNGWIHLELGAGNYGSRKAHIKTSLSKTALIEIGDVSDAKHYVNALDEMPQGGYIPQEQYGVLFWTLDQLVERYGEAGVFHVNDIQKGDAFFATEKLMEYATEKGYDSVIIEAVPGDYRSTDFEQNLLEYSRVKYDSVHLKNPEHSFFYGSYYVAASEDPCQQVRVLLQKLANFSEEGLYFFVINVNREVPQKERTEFMEKGIFYLETEEWEPVPYIFRGGGRIINKENGAVFFIESSS